MTGNFTEPPINPDDTHPTQTVPQVSFDSQGRVIRPIPLWRRAIGFLSLVGALAFTVATIFVLLSAEGDTSEPTPMPTEPETVLQNPTDIPPTEAETDTLPTDVPQEVEPTTVVALPTLDADTASAILNTPLTAAQTVNIAQVERQPLNPFTIVPDRPRNEIIVYEAVRGDTIDSIAQRFNLELETIAWSNDRRIVLVLRPGDRINIPPVDGVLTTAIGSRTIAEYAAQYGIEDPFVVLDSPLNADALAGLSPDSVPPNGVRIFFPGGEAEEIVWTPTVVREGGGGAGDPSGGNFISFAPGEAGSCGRVANPGGGASWRKPLNSYTITRGYSGWHTGIDLAAPSGTPVGAANGGRVIFAGWNSFGYGYTVVLAHGPFTTLYGHLSSINVSCGQDVAPGQIIGGVGSTGNSSGDHLHFEIRFNDAPQDPAFTISF